MERAIPVELKAMPNPLTAASTRLSTLVARAAPKIDANSLITPTPTLPTYSFRVTPMSSNRLTV